MQIIVISGEVGSGKTTLASELERQFAFRVLKTKEEMKQLAREKSQGSLEPERGALQAYGEHLDKQTKGRWVETALTKLLHSSGKANFSVVVDSVRIRDQIRNIRRAYGFAVTHIHLKAPEEVLAKRYKSRKGSGVKEFSKYSDVRQSPTEASVGELEAIADVVIDTERCTVEDVLVRAATHLSLYSRDYDRCVDVVVGGQFGSEGKGHVVSYLSREYDILVRVGGPNAGHKVFRDPEPFTHHQLPSGTWRNSEAALVLAPGCVLNAQHLMKEIADCKVDSRRLSIDPQAMIISDADVKSERSLVNRIGSTGQGVGAATARRINHRSPELRLARDVADLRPFIRETWEILERAYKDHKKILVEGTQGSGLSLFHGVYPYVTSRDTSVSGCLSEAGIPPTRARRVVLVCRSYPIRVQNPPKGTSGPMGKEIKWSTIERRSGISLSQLRTTERTSTTNRRRRVAEFSWQQLRRSAALNAPTDIALTFVDYLQKDNENARRFEQLDSDTIRFIEEIQRVAEAPVSLISTRFGYRSIIDRRAW